MGMNMKKWAVLAGALVVGLIVLTASLQGGTPAAAPEPAPVPTDAPAPTKTESPAAPEPPDATSAALGLYNGTATAGLADKTAKKMSGYNVVQVGNTLEQQAVSSVFYVKAKDQRAAEALALAEYPDADVTALPKGTQVSVDGVTEKITNDIQVVVFLGDDQL